jgi:hypothetical protein
MSAPSGTLSAFAPVVHAVTVDKAITSFLIEWLPTYLRAAERLDGRVEGYLTRPRTYSTHYNEDDDDFLSDKALPAVFVSSDGFTDWDRNGSRQWSANARVSVTVVSRGRHLPEARLNASLYIATVTNLMLDRPSLGGIAGGVMPRSEQPRPLDDPSNRSRVLTAGMGEYDVFIPYLRHGRGGPISPEAPLPTDPLPEFGEVSEVDVALEGYPPGYDPRDP